MFCRCGRPLRTLEYEYDGYHATFNLCEVCDRAELAAVLNIDETDDWLDGFLAEVDARR
jgi:hypothetical protein